jgi:hypothetical protein
LLVCCAAALTAFVLPALADAAAVTPASLTNCYGGVSADSGAKAAGEPNLLDYKFNCDTGITAYSVIVWQDGDDAIGGTIDDYNSTPSVFEDDDVTPSSTESITCEGTTPSDGINCNTGTQGAKVTAGHFVQGTADLVGAYCRHLPLNAKGKPITKPGTLSIPKATVQLIVTDLTGAEDGPFTLGSTAKCPKVPNVVPQPKPKPKKKTKAKTKTKTKTKAKSTARKR